MNKFLHYSLLTITILFWGGNCLFAQYQMQPSLRHAPSNNPMTVVSRNYHSFTTRIKDSDPEVVQANARFNDHPEAGILQEGAPSGDCYELIGERTEINKTFVRKGTNGKELLAQTSNMPMHYKDAQGRWRTIKALLEPDKNHEGVFAAYEQPAPISINTKDGIVSIGKDGKNFQFNNNLELFYERPDGSTTTLGHANWSHYTAGDEGVYVTNAWPGIDIEMYVIRGAIKTNFQINHSLPEYAEGKLLIRDHLKMDDGMSLYSNGKSKVAGNMEIRNADGEKVYNISAATACEKGNVKTTLKLLNFNISGNDLDIEIPGNFLNREDASYPVIIDPLVSLATSSTVTGSTYSVDWTIPCVYSNAATVPANITITDIQYAFTFATGSYAWVSDGALDFRKGSCRSPMGATGVTGIYWCCSTTFSPGSCYASGGTTYSILSDISACVPPPQCPSYNLNLTMDFYQMTDVDFTCGTTFIYATTPLVITVIGHTVEFVSATSSPSTICVGGSSTLTGAGVYGVPPYSYSWTPGPVTGSPVTVSPTSTTTYFLTITDLCGNTATGSTTVTVNTVAPITGTATVCVGNTTALADATGGAHSWSSSNPGVATVTAGGVVSGVSAGTTTITYTITGTGCYATLVVTVTPLPSSITGTTTLCPGATSLLSSATGGGTWSSSNPGVATISTTGLVTAISSGTTTITYNLGGSCYVTVLVTVSSTAAITGSLSVCAGSTTTLSDATAGGTWSSSATGIATVGSTTGVVTGVASGTATITYTTAGGCYVTAVVTVNSISPITGTASVCVGNTTVLSNATAGGTWSSSNTAIATVVAGTGVVTGVAAGTVTISYTTAAGCIATIIVTVNTVASITSTLTTICSGETTNLSDATAGGTWSSSATGIAVVNAATGVVTGIAAGTATITYTTAAGCTATILITVSGIAPITGTMSMCVGGTTVLSETAGAGTWTCGSTTIATIGSTTGLVSGISAGTAQVTFTTTSGCAAFAIVTVNAIPPITGTLSFCVGNTTNLSSSVPGGTWSSASTAVATIGATTGIVSGVTVGTSVITYTSPAGCTSTAIVTVNPLPNVITGTTSVCQNFTTNLTDATTGGTWSSSNTAIANIDPASGIVTGFSGGTVTISYTSAAGCVITVPFTVNGTPPAITGPSQICVGDNANLNDALTGGTWASGSPTIANIGSTSGVVSGISAGIAQITYTSAFGCYITTTVTVNPIPNPINGNLVVCIGSTSLLNDETPGGSWSSSATAIATIDASTGLASGIAAGNSTITYTVSGCITTAVFTVNPLPDPITGDSSVCVGSVSALSDAVPGGTWLSGNSSIATIDPVTGVVTAKSLGTVLITYMSGAGCYITSNFTVNYAPSFAFYVKPDVCIGDTVTVELTSSSAGITNYTWDFGGASLITASSHSGGPYVISWSTAGTHFVTVTADASVSCPSLTVQDTVEVHNYPDASIMPLIYKNGNSNVCLGDSILFRANNDKPGDFYFWSPIQMFMQNNMENVYGIVSQVGYVNLKVTDRYGCASTDSIYLNAKPCCNVEFPDAFTPNGDGLNDIFRPISLGAHMVHVFRIMNRWGQCVYEADVSNFGWNGLFNGVPQEIGTYYFMFSYDCNGVTTIEKGEVNLIR